MLDLEQEPDVEPHSICQKQPALSDVYAHRSSLLNLSLLSVLFDEAAGKMTREEGKHDLGSAPEDCFPDNLSVPPTTAELVANPLSSRSGRGPRRGSLFVMER